MSETKRADAVNPDVDYEKNDLNVFYIAMAGLLIIIAAIIIHAAVWRLFNYFNARAADKGARPVSLVQSKPPPPPEPRLQVNPSSDLRQLRMSEDAALHGYGWVDRQAGVVRIPIEQAMKRIVEKGLPPPQQMVATPMKDDRSGARQRVKAAGEINPRSGQMKGTR